MNRYDAGHEELWITFVVIASLAMSMIFGWLSPFTIGPAIVIAVIWYFGFYKGRHDKRSVTLPSSPAESSPCCATAHRSAVRGVSRSANAFHPSC